MPIYEYICPERKDPNAEHAGHVFEKIVPVAQYQEKQECPNHPGTMCERKEISNTSWVWGMNVVHWSAGLGHNLHGMNHAAKK